jgi:hypothetical protein
MQLQEHDIHGFPNHKQFGFPDEELFGVMTYSGYNIIHDGIGYMGVCDKHRSRYYSTIEECVAFIDGFLLKNG